MVMKLYYKSQWQLEQEGFEGIKEDSSEYFFNINRCGTEVYHTLPYDSETMLKIWEVGDRVRRKTGHLGTILDREPARIYIRWDHEPETIITENLIGFFSQHLELVKEELTDTDKLVLHELIYGKPEEYEEVQYTGEKPSYLADEWKEGDIFYNKGYKYFFQVDKLERVDNNTEITVSRLFFNVSLSEYIGPNTFKDWVKVPKDTSCGVLHTLEQKYETVTSEEFEAELKKILEGLDEEEMDLTVGPEELNYFSPPKCECGSEKAQIPGHSTWCPKYKKED
jgi:hypothetical protein